MANLSSEQKESEVMQSYLFFHQMMIKKESEKKISHQPLLNFVHFNL
jgi:hypothetical protein